MMGCKKLFLFVACLLSFHLPIAARASENPQDGTVDVTSGVTHVGREDAISPATADAGRSTEDVEVFDRSPSAPAPDAAPVAEEVVDAQPAAARVPMPGTQFLPQIVKTAAEVDPILAALVMLVPLLWEQMNVTQRNAQQKQMYEQRLRGLGSRKQAADSGDSSKPLDNTAA